MDCIVPKKFPYRLPECVGTLLAPDPLAYRESCAMPEAKTGWRD
jgi:hypothetical protein